MTDAPTTALSAESPDRVKELGCDRPLDLARLEVHLEALANFLHAPGDWGYGTRLADLTIAVKEALYEVRKALKGKIEQ